MTREQAAQAAIALAYAGLECYLGRTPKFQAGSVMELAWNALHGIYEIVSARTRGGLPVSIVSESVSVSKPVRDLGKVITDAIKKAKAGENPGQIAQEELGAAIPLLSELSQLGDDQKADPAAVRRAGLLFVEDLVEAVTGAVPGK